MNAEAWFRVAMWSVPRSGGFPATDPTQMNVHAPTGSQNDFEGPETVGASQPRNVIPRKRFSPPQPNGCEGLMFPPEQSSKYVRTMIRGSEPRNFFFN